MVIIFLIVVLINLSISLLSIVRLLVFITESKLLRGLGYFLLVPLSILYINNVFIVLSYLWGIPAFRMVRPSYYENGKRFNNKDFCLHDILDSSYQKVDTLQFWWFQFSYSLDHVSHIVWAVVMFIGFMILQTPKRK